MIESLIDPFRQTFDFRGRSRRRDYWRFVAWQLAVLVVVSIGANAALSTAGMLVLLPDLMIWGLLAYTAIFGLPTLALQVRRLHDQEKAGWWVMVGFLPYIGAGWLIFLMLQQGTWGANKYGPDPRHAGWDCDLFSYVMPVARR